MPIVIEGISQDVSLDTLGEAESYLVCRASGGRPFRLRVAADAVEELLVQAHGTVPKTAASDDSDEPLDDSDETSVADRLIPAQDEDLDEDGVPSL